MVFGKKSSGFTPLENARKASDFRERNSLTGFTPLEKAGDFKERNSLTGFTLMELMVAMIVIAVFAASALPAFNKAMENVKDKEAQTVLAAVRAAQWIYYNDTKEKYDITGKIFADNMGLLTSYMGDPNSTATWYTYTITDCAGPNYNTFTIKGARKNSTKAFMINQNGVTSSSP